MWDLKKKKKACFEIKEDFKQKQMNHALVWSLRKES